MGRHLELGRAALHPHPQGHPALRAQGGQRAVPQRPARADRAHQPGRLHVDAADRQRLQGGQGGRARHAHPARAAAVRRVPARAERMGSARHGVLQRLPVRLRRPLLHGCEQLLGIVHRTGLAARALRRPRRRRRAGQRAVDQPRRPDLEPSQPARRPRRRRHPRPDADRRPRRVPGTGLGRRRAGRPFHLRDRMVQQPLHHRVAGAGARRPVPERRGAGRRGRQRRQRELRAGGADRRRRHGDHRLRPRGLPAPGAAGPVAASAAVARQGCQRAGRRAGAGAHLPARVRRVRADLA